MRVKLIGQAKRVFRGVEEGFIGKVWNDEFWLDGMKTLLSVWNDEIAPFERRPDRRGFGMLYIRNFDDPVIPVKFSASGHLAQILGQVVVGDCVQYHIVRLWP